MTMLVSNVTCFDAGPFSRAPTPDTDKWTLFSNSATTRPSPIGIVAEAGPTAIAFFFHLPQFSMLEGDYVADEGNAGVCPECRPWCSQVPVPFLSCERDDRPTTKVRCQPIPGPIFSTV